MSRGQFASLPDGETRSRISSDGLTVTVWDESGVRHMKLPYSNSPGAEEIRRQWVSCIAEVTGPAGSWRSIESARAGSSRSRSFLTWAAERGIGSLDDLAADDWADFVAWSRDKYPKAAAKGRNSRLGAVRTILLQHRGLPYEVGQVLAQRFLETQDQPLPEHYTVSELQQIRSAAKRTLRAALKRIEPNWALALTHMASVAPAERARWHALHRLLGAPHRRLAREHGRALGLLDSYSNVQMEEARSLLFLTTEEGIAAYAAIIATTGENSSTTARRSLPSTAASAGAESITIFTTEREKRRRASDTALMAENVEATSPLGKVLTLVMDCTAPARHSAHVNPEALIDNHAPDHHSWKELSSSSLILFMRRSGVLANQITHIPKSPNWLPGELCLDLRRLHRTYLTRVAQQPVDNRQLTWIDAYILKDPQRLQELEDIHRSAQRKALDAAESMAVRLLTEQEAVSEGLDPAPAAKGTRCRDIMHNPDTGTYCNKSWLSCLGCRNAYVVTSNLSPLVALLDLLDMKRQDDDDRDRWRREYFVPWQQLTTILSEVQPEAVSTARSNISPELKSKVWQSVFVDRGEL